MYYTSTYVLYCIVQIHGYCTRKHLFIQYFHAVGKWVQEVCPLNKDNLNLERCCLLRGQTYWPLMPNALLYSNLKLFHRLDWCFDWPCSAVKGSDQCSITMHVSECVIQPSMGATFKEPLRDEFPLHSLKHWEPCDGQFFRSSFWNRDLFVKQSVSAKSELLKSQLFDCGVSIVVLIYADLFELSHFRSLEKWKRIICIPNHHWWTYHLAQQLNRRTSRSIPWFLSSMTRRGSRPSARRLHLKVDYNMKILGWAYHHQGCCCWQRFGELRRVPRDQ